MAFSPVTSSCRNTPSKTAVRRDSSLLPFSQAIRFPAPFLVDEFVCRVPAFSTLSTSSTAPLLHRLETSFNWRYLASCQFGMRFALGEECNRVTDAPQSTRRLLGHISPQPSSVPIQARQ